MYKFSQVYLLFFLDWFEKVDIIIWKIVSGLREWLTLKVGVGCSLVLKLVPSTGPVEREWKYFVVTVTFFKILLPDIGLIIF